MNQDHDLLTHSSEAEAIVINRSPQMPTRNYKQKVSLSNDDNEDSTASQARGVSRYTLFVLFTLSGFSGLIYESIWTHYLKLFLGHAAYAQTLVLIIFMGGMAIGSWLAARHSQKWKNLLLSYAIIEGSIGLSALLFHNIFTGVTSLTYSWIIPALPSGTAISLFKWGLATALILPQSILLGMTFPLMSGSLLRRFPQESGSTIAMLYFTNSIGATVGILTSGFVLIGMFGLPGTMLVAGLINIGLALFVWLLSKGDIEVPLTSTTMPFSSPQSLRTSPVILLGVAVITGASSFMYEIGWIRMLSLVLGSSTHSFEIMLSAFILGLALGGLWIEQRIDNLKNQIWFLGLVQLFMGALALTTLPLYSNTFKFMAFSVNAVSRTDAGYLLFNFSAHIVSLFIMLPATFCAGMTLPLLTAILLRTYQGERAIGHIYAANTIGAIIGVLFAVHSMPMLGLKGVILLGAALDISLGGLLLRMALTSPSLKPLYAPLSLGITALVYVIGWVQLDPHQMASGVYRYGRENLSRNDQILFHRDGKTATVSLSHSPTNGATSILTNGKPDAAVQMAVSKDPSPDEVTMTLLAATALGFHLEAKTIANIGMGSGMTSQVLLASPYLQKLDTIEIEPLMVAAARGFLPRNEAVFSDSRSHIYYEDAKSFFSARKQQYDIVVSEPSNPWVSGVSGLFSQEFYQLLGNYLQSDGILVQWIHQYEFTTELLASIVNALSPHFSDYVMFNTNDKDIVIIAKKNGLIGLFDERLFTHKKLTEELAKAGIKTIQDVAVRRIGDKKLLTPFFQSYGVPANSDYFPYLDLYAAHARFTKQTATLLTSIGIAPVPLQEMLDRQPDWMEKALSLNSDFTKSESAMNAQVIRDILLGRNVENLQKVPLKEHALATLLTLPLQSCQSNSAATLWFEALFEVSQKLLPYLSPQTLQQIWERIESTSCASQLPDEYRQWITLLKAVGNREPKGMVVIAHEILQRAKKQENKDRYRFLVAAQLLGLLTQGKTEEAKEVWKIHALSFSDENSYLRLLVSHAMDNPTRLTN